MKTKQKQEIRALSSEKLSEKIRQAELELAKSHLVALGSERQNVKIVRSARRELSVLKTIAREKELLSQSESNK